MAHPIPSVGHSGIHNNQFANAFAKEFIFNANRMQKGPSITFLLIYILWIGQSWLVNSSNPRYHFTMSFTFWCIKLSLTKDINLLSLSPVDHHRFPGHIYSELDFPFTMLFSFNLDSQIIANENHIWVYFNSTCTRMNNFLHL